MKLLSELDQGGMNLDTVCLEAIPLISRSEPQKWQVQRLHATGDYVEEFKRFMKEIFPRLRHPRYSSDQWEFIVEVVIRLDPAKWGQLFVGKDAWSGSTLTTLLRE